MTINTIPDDCLMYRLPYVTVNVFMLSIGKKKAQSHCLLSSKLKKIHQNEVIATAMLCFMFRLKKTCMVLL